MGARDDMEEFEDIMGLDIQAFFSYVETIRYGYQDQSGQLHFAGEEDFTVQDYAFSSPEDVVKNNCGWCLSFWRKMDTTILQQGKIMLLSC